MSAFKDAADILRRDGWCQRVYHSAGRHCMLGALRYALIDRGRLDRRFTSVTDVEDSPYFPILVELTGYSMPHEWNDAEGRTAQEVIGLLEQADRVADERGLP